MSRTVLLFGSFIAFVMIVIISSVLLSSVSRSVTAVVTFNATDPLDDVSGQFANLIKTGLYGTSSPQKNVSGLVCLALTVDGHNHGCQNPYENVGVVPWIALVERGGCTFAKKIQEATRANASGIIVLNNSTDDLVMGHDGAEEIVAVSISPELGSEVLRRIEKGDNVTVQIFRRWRAADMYFPQDKTLIIFAYLSLVLMAISMAWLIVYFARRSNIMMSVMHFKHRRMRRKIIANLPKRTLEKGDEALAEVDACAVCIETYKIRDVIRILPCRHIFHCECVDPWLEWHKTCPMCKFDVVESRTRTNAGAVRESLTRRQEHDVQPQDDAEASTSSTCNLTTTTTV